MAQYQAFDSSVEVNGETVLSIVDGMGHFRDRAAKFLRDNGIEDPQPGQWYPQQNWLDAFRTIGDVTGEFTLFNIGQKIPENATFPPEIDDIEKALSSIDVAYHLNHRIGDKVLFNPETGEMFEGIGHYGYEKAGDRKIVLKCENPYPCDFDRGIIEAMAQKFLPPGSFALVRHDDSGECRKKGGNACTYNVTW